MLYNNVEVTCTICIAHKYINIGINIGTIIGIRICIT